MSDIPVKGVEGATRAQVTRFLEASGRRFFVMVNSDLVESLPEPFGESMGTVQQLVACYRDHRRARETGFVEDVRVGVPGGGATRVVTVPIMKTEVLEPEEWDDLIDWATTQRQIAIEERNKRVNVRRG